MSSAPQYVLFCKQSSKFTIQLMRSISPARLIHGIITHEVDVIYFSKHYIYDWVNGSNVILILTFFINYENYVNFFYYIKIHILHVNFLQLNHILF